MLGHVGVRMREEPRRPAGFRTEQLDEWREHSSSWTALGAGCLSRIKQVHELTGKTCSSNICLNPLMLQSPPASLKHIISCTHQSSPVREIHLRSVALGSGERVTCRESQEGTGGYNLCVHHQDGTEKEMHIKAVPAHPQRPDQIVAMCLQQ